MYGYSPMMHDEYGGWDIFSMVLWFVFLIVAVLIVVRLLKGQESDTSPKVDPLDIAKERYAKGEITKEQFGQIKKDLSAK